MLFVRSQPMAQNTGTAVTEYSTEWSVWTKPLGNSGTISSSPHLPKNTIIIFTSDHASYMEKAYLDAMAEVTSVKPKQSFWDTIPLIIYDPTRELPNSYDAKVRTSVDFTPSLLHYLGVANRSNSFVGESIFETEANRKRTYGVVCADHLLIIDREGEFHNPKYPKQLASTVKLFDKYTRTVKHFEMNRQIWPTENPQ